MNYLINLVLWQPVALCKSYATDSAPGYVCRMLFIYLFIYLFTYLLHYASTCVFIMLKYGLEGYGACWKRKFCLSHLEPLVTKL